MTTPHPDKLEREREKLYLTDAELIRRMGLPEKRGRQVILAFEADPRSGFPKKDKFFGGRRYWPAVKAFLDNRHRVNVAASPEKRGVA